MHMKKFTARLLSLSLICAPFSVSGPAHAQTASGMGDLIGARGSSLDDAMSDRGYAFARNEGAASMYWNAGQGRCVSALVDDGRVQSIESASANLCGKSDSGSSKSNNNAAAAVAVGALAVGLAAALSSHHKHSDNKNNNTQYNSEYERGYNDGLYGGHYADDDSEAYHSGYMAGETERNNRRHANSSLVRGAPAAAQEACKNRGDQFWGLSYGSTVPVSVYNYGQGNYEVTVASGHRRANCSVNDRGVISGFNPM
jgi:hypothetical protein